MRILYGITYKGHKGMSPAKTNSIAWNVSPDLTLGPSIILV